MTAAGKCYVCGDCWWSKCENPADYTHDVTLKRNGRLLYEGLVDLCAGHTLFAQENSGHLNLAPEAIEQALHLQRLANREPKKLKAAR